MGPQKARLVAWGVYFVVESSHKALIGFKWCVIGYQELTPGSETDAWMKDDMQIKKRYAKKIGTAGET